MFLMIIIMPIMGLLHIAGWNQESVVKNTAGIKLAIKAFKEMVKVFKDIKIPVYPKKLVFLSILPDFILFPLIKKALASKGAEIGIFGHAGSESRQSEMKSLTLEFSAILKQSSLPATTWDGMLEFIRYRKDSEGGICYYN